MQLGPSPLQIFAQHLIFFFECKRKAEGGHFADPWAPAQNEDVWAFQTVHVPKPEVHQRTRKDNLA